jgi:hypothetical protein
MKPEIAKVGVEGSNPFARSRLAKKLNILWSASVSGRANARRG